MRSKVIIGAIPTLVGVVFVVIAFLAFFAVQVLKPKVADKTPRTVTLTITGKTPNQIHQELDSLLNLLDYQAKNALKP